jgi:3-oxoacyl-[acyl-carrier protein] reductase
MERLIPNMRKQRNAMRLKDKVAIVTGGAAGIGREFSLGLAHEGAKVVIADVNANAAKTLAESIRNRGGEAWDSVTDVSKADDCQRMAREAIDRFGRIDILVNNAAVYMRVSAVKVPLWEMSPEEWNKVLNVNLTGVFLCCRAVLPQMIAQGSGKVINMASAHALIGTTNFAHYVASKGGILSLTKALAKEAGKYNINVNCLAAGSILSEDNAEDPKVIAYREIAVASRAIKRIGYPKDLLGTVIFLASSDSDFITGQTIVVDGGAVMH